jgi:hypothetical protein
VRLMPGVAWAALAAGLTLCNATSADPMRPWVAPASSPDPRTAKDPGKADAASVRSPLGDAASAPARAGVGSARTAPWNPPAAVDLVAIREDSDGRRQALIGESWLKPGEKFTDAQGPGTLVFIGTHHVETQRGPLRSRTDLLPPLQPARQTPPARADHTLAKPLRAPAPATPGVQQPATAHRAAPAPQDPTGQASAKPGLVAPTQIRLNQGKKSP